MNDLVKIMTDGAMKAAILHGREKGITNDNMYDAMVVISHKLQEIMKVEWQEFMDTIKDATEAKMGESMYKTIMNTYCNSWAVKALS